eukprot:UN18346
MEFEQKNNMKCYPCPEEIYESSYSAPEAGESNVSRYARKKKAAW